MDEARTVIRRLERIETLQSSHAPAAELLAEVRQLLREGEAWLAAEHEGARGADGDGVRTGSRSPTGRAEAALDGCRSTLAETEEVTPQTAATTTL